MSSAPQLTPSQLQYAETAQWKEFLRQELAYLRVSIPAIVQSFDPVTQTAAVQIAIREVVRTPKGPQDTEIAPIYNVPVCLPRAGGFSLTLPLKAGDEGMLIFCDMCIDLWWARGGVQNQFERRRHDLSDCGFYPMGWSQPRVLSNYSTNSAQLRSDDNTVIVDVAAAAITLTAPKVSINSSGDVDITASGKVNIQGEQIVAASSSNDTKIDGKVFLSHQHTQVQTGTGDTGPVF
jgi:hypothetical protein